MKKIQNWLKAHYIVHIIISSFVFGAKRWIKGMLILWSTFEASKNGIKWIVATFDWECAKNFIDDIRLFVKGLVGESISAVLLVAFVISVIYAIGSLWSQLSIKLSIPQTNKIICVKFGNIFKCNGVRVVGVNNFFDTNVDGYIVSPNSLHGQLLTSLNDNVKLFDAAVKRINDVTPQKVERKKGKQYMYPIGTSTWFKMNDGIKYVITALSDTNNDKYEAHASINDINQATQKALIEAESIAEAGDIYFPLWGTKLARSGLNHQEALCLMLQSVKRILESKTTEGKISVVVYWGDFGKVNLNAIKSLWESINGVC